RWLGQNLFDLPNSPVFPVLASVVQGSARIRFRWLRGALRQWSGSRCLGKRRNHERRCLRHFAQTSSAATSPGSRPWMVRRVVVAPQGSPVQWWSPGAGPTRSLDVRHVPVVLYGQGGPARVRRLGRG